MKFQHLAPIMLSLVLLLVSTGTVQAETLGTEFTYQGRLTEDGNPVNQACDFQFGLYDAVTAGSQVGTTQTKTNVSVGNGLFSVPLDFGANAFTGDARWLDVTVRCPAGSGNYTALTPRQKLTATPYALNSSTAPWAGLTGIPSGFSDNTDDNTTYTAGTGLTLTGTVFTANTGDVQQRITGTCAVGSSIRIVSADGTVTCETDTDATYSAGSGFTLSGTVFSANTLVLQSRVTGTCAAGSSIRVITGDGTVTCETDDDTTYTAGSGLTLTSTTFAVNTGDIQQRVTGTCAAGNSIRVISADGTVACEPDTDTDTDTTYTAGSGLTLTSTTFAINTGDIQQRVTGTCAAGNSIRVISADGTVACEADTTAGLSTATLSTGSTLSVGTEYHADTATAAFTATLPSAPVDGSHIRIVDVKGTFDTNNLTVSRGGSDTIEGSTSVLLSSENGVFDFHYDSGTTRWSLAEHNTPAPVTLHQARMERSTAQSIPNGTNTKVVFDAEDFDTGGIADPSTGTVTITQAGRYLLNGSVCFSSAFNVQAQIWVGSTTVTRQFLAESASAVGVAWCANVTAVQDLSVNDTVNLYAYQGSGASRNTDTGNGDDPFLEVIQLPTAVLTNVAQAVEYVYVQLAGAQTSNVAAGDHVKFDTVVESSGTSVTLDTSTTYTTTAGAASIGRFTLKGGKTYRLDAGIPWADDTESRFKWFDATNSADISGSTIHVETSSTSTGVGCGCAIFTATSDTLVELRVTANDGVAQFGHTTDKLYPSAIIQTIADGTQVTQFTAATSSAAGTSGFIPKPESGDQGALLLGNSDWTDPATELFVDTSNNRVGIGTASPASTLHITPSTAAALQIDPFGAASGELGELRFLELAANGTNYVGLQAPNLITGDVIWTLPNADGTDGQALVTDGSGALSWANAGGGTDLKDADSDTKIQVEESADEDKIRFDTAGSERVIISGDTVGIGTSTPDASALLEVSSTNKGMLVPRMTTTQRDAISSPATGLEIYNTTTSKFNYYNGSNWTAVGVGTNRYIHAKLSADPTGVGANTDIVFATTIVGNGISLNASTGVFTLTAGATYELDAALWASAYNTANGLLIYEWVDSSNVSLGGTEAAAYRIDGSVGVHNQVLAKLIITPSSDQQVKLRVTSSTGTASINARFSYASITQINSSGSDLITTSYIHATLSSNVAGVGNATDIVFNKELSGSGITLNTSTGVFTLKANRTYELEAALYVASFTNATTAYLGYEWVNSADTSPGGTWGESVNPVGTIADGNQQTAKLIITTTADKQVKLRTIFAGATGTVAASLSYASITQIGTSEWLTGTPFLHNGNSLGELGVLGTNDSYGHRISRVRRLINGPDLTR